MKLRRAVITAAGLGTRFLPASKAVPKEMFPVYDKPVIQYVVEEAVAAGCTEVLIIISADKRLIGRHFDRAPQLERALARSGRKQALRRVKELAGLANIRYVTQKEQKGLGNAVGYAERFAGDEPFALLLADDIMWGSPSIAPLEKARCKPYGMALSVEKVPRRMVPRYGIVDVTKTKKRGVYTVKGMVEKPELKDAPSDLAIIGRYLLTPDIFAAIRKTRPGALGEIQITDALGNYLLDGGSITACVFRGQRYDAGDKVGLIKTSLEMALRDKSVAPEMRAYLKRLS